MTGAGRAPRDWAEQPLATAVPDAVVGAAVVVVDDMPDNVLLLETILRRAGADVRGFTDPREAVAWCSVSRPDLVLVDMHMPHLDGMGVMAALSRSATHGSFLPVVVLTADVTADTRRRVLAAGAKDFLTKPLDLDEVVLRVRNLLETSILYRRLEEQNQHLRVELEARAAAEREARAWREDRRRLLDEVVAGEGLRIAFQPIVDVRSGDVVGAEALARFDIEPVRPPDAWFAEAAQVGRGVDLEVAAIAAAVDHLDDLPPEVFLSVNASPATVVSSSLRDVLVDVRGERVVVELTEHDRVEDYGPLVEALGNLRSLGVRIAVDDTGAGYASLEHLLLLQAEITKLDLALTRGIDADPVRRSLAAALVAFGRDIDSTIVAEGVETAGECAALADLGVPWAQGYHLAPPDRLPIPTNVGVG